MSRSLNHYATTPNGSEMERTFRAFHLMVIRSVLEGQLQRQLQQPGIVPGAGNGGEGIRGKEVQTSRLRELRCVGGVEGFCPKLQPDRIRKVEVLEDGGIQVLVPGSASLLRTTAENRVVRLAQSSG